MLKWKARVASHAMRPVPPHIRLPHPPTRQSPSAISTFSSSIFAAASLLSAFPRPAFHSLQIWGYISGFSCSALHGQSALALPSREKGETPWPVPPRRRNIGATSRSFLYPPRFSRGWAKLIKCSYLVVLLYRLQHEKTYCVKIMLMAEFLLMPVVRSGYTALLSNVSGTPSYSNMTIDLLEP
jgi:hypothetical protein